MLANIFWHLIEAFLQLLKGFHVLRAQLSVVTDFFGHKWFLSNVQNIAFYSGDYYSTLYLLSA